MSCYRPMLFVLCLSAFIVLCEVEGGRIVSFELDQIRHKGAYNKYKKPRSEIMRGHLPLSFLDNKDELRLNQKSNRSSQNEAQQLSNTHALLHSTPSHLYSNNSALRTGIQNIRPSNERRTIEEAMLSGNPETAYVIQLNFGNVTAGSVLQTLNCIVDTGSSNLAVAAYPEKYVQHYYNQSMSKSYQPTGKGDFSVQYVVASWSAHRVQDLVSVNGFNNLDSIVEFGAIYTSEKFFQNDGAYDGIVGLAYVNIAEPGNDPVVPFLDHLVAQHEVSNIFALQLCEMELNGKMSFGGVASDMGRGNVYYTPLKAQTYYPVQVTQMAVNGFTLDLDCSVYNSPGYSIVDSGTSDFIVPPSVHSAITARLPLSFSDSSTRDAFYQGDVCLSITAGDVNLLPNISISLVDDSNAGQQFDIYAYPWHYMRKSYEMGPDNKLHPCYVFAITPACVPGTGMIIGITVLAGQMAVFDRVGQRVGFASSRCATATGVPLPSLSPPYKRPSDSTCAPNTKVSCSSPKKLSMYIWIGIGAGGAIVLCLIVAILYMVFSKPKPRVSRPYKEQARAHSDRAPLSMDEAAPSFEPLTLPPRQPQPQQQRSNPRTTTSTHSTTMVQGNRVVNTTPSSDEQLYGTTSTPFQPFSSPTSAHQQQLRASEPAHPQNPFTHAGTHGPNSADPQQHIELSTHQKNHPPSEQPKTLRERLWIEDDEA